MMRNLESVGGTGNPVADDPAINIAVQMRCQELLRPVASQTQVANPHPHAFAGVIRGSGRVCHLPSMAIGLQIVPHQAKFAHCGDLR